MGDFTDSFISRGTCVKSIFKLLLVTVSISQIVAQNTEYLRRNTYRRRAVLDPQEKYLLEWVTNWDEKRIYFNVTVETKGYVGFGLARKGKMQGADIVIGGVDEDGKPYFSDRYAIANQQPKLDPSQDWDLEGAWERGNWTFLSFSRLLDTCDEEYDLPITDDLLSIIWSYSERDDTTQYHFQHRGSYDAYLTDPELVPDDIDDFTTRVRKGQVQDLSVMSLRGRRRMPRGQDTLYWCTFHKVPTRSPQHIVGFHTAFETEFDRDHVHHLLLHRCRAPPGVNSVEFFNGAARSGGSECYLLDRPNPNPVPYCREVIHGWGVGGRGIFLPENAGVPMSNDEPDEYFMLQVHYDNTAQLPNVTASVSLQLFYTDKIRQYDAGILQMGATQPGQTTIVIPPSSTNHVIMGHCAPQCTDRMFGSTERTSEGEAEGVKLIAMILHTHTTGIGARALQFRGSRELPWILRDDNYNFNFQQFRLLKEPREVKPGDLLLSRCTYDNTGRNGSVVTGGFATTQEMCTVFAYYYSHRPGFALCRGEITNQDYNFGLLGIRNSTWDPSIREMIITDPVQYRGVTIRDYLNTQIDWNIEFRERLQREQISQPQTSTCPRFYFEDPEAQIRHQLDNRILERTRRLPGSDGRPFTSVDEDFMFESRLPANAQRYRPPQQCTATKRYKS